MQLTSIITNVNFVNLYLRRKPLFFAQAGWSLTSVWALYFCWSSLLLCCNKPLLYLENLNILKDAFITDKKHYINISTTTATSKGTFKKLKTPNTIITVQFKYNWVSVPYWAHMGLNTIDICCFTRMLKRINNKL